MASRVLIVDDDPVSLLVAQHIVESAGHDVTAVDGVEAARAAIDSSAEAFDLLICDYLMPDHTGLDLLELLGDTLGAEAPPFVLLTGFGEADEVGDARIDQVTCFLTKPVQSGELLDVVDRMSRV